MDKKKLYKVFIGKSISLFFAFLFFNSLSAQTTFWTETFDGSVCAVGSGCDPSIIVWNRVSLGGEGTSANRFYVSCQENGMPAGTCGAGCGSNQTLHIGNVSISSAAFFFCPSGDCGAAYDASSAAEIANTRCESPTISCAGYSGISVSFDYIEGGQNTSDNATLWYYDGSSWAQIDDMPKSVNTGCFGQGKWTARTVSLPTSADNNANVKIGFRWVNNGDGTGSDPSFAVNDVVLKYSIVLPIKLKSFDVSMDQTNNALIKWSTESEVNNDYFTVERSDDGINFESLANIPGAGNSTIHRNYSISDDHPLSGISYYRLKQTDFNGETSYSFVRSVSNFGIESGQVLVYPNPTSGLVHVVSDKKYMEEFEVRILDTKGTCLFYQCFRETNHATIDLSEFPSGIYFLMSNIDGVLSRKKIVKN